MNIQLDTNILARLAQASHPQYATALAALQHLESAGQTPCIVPQNLFEFWAVATRPVAGNGLGLTVTEAKFEFDTLKRSFLLLADSLNLLDEWERLIVDYNCKGKSAHDARIVAAMNMHGVRQILTFNVADFVRYPAIAVLDPAVVISGTKPAAN